MARIGINGGSGGYDIKTLKHRQWVEVRLPFGAPSDALLFNGAAT